jgi:predicted dehydrogenase
MLNLAVIGVGGWGKNHARVLNDLGCLAAICDVDIQRAKEIAIKSNGARSYSSLDEMLEKERLNGCLVCTPTKTHSFVARKATFEL